jgi:hypothetical protein
MKGRYMLIVSLWLRDDDVAAFEYLERRASALLTLHGGRIESAIRPVRSATDANTPFEIHVVSFNERQGYADYRSDPKVQALIAEREKIISDTSILEGYDAGIR